MIDFLRKFYEIVFSFLFKNIGYLNFRLFYRFFSTFNFNLNWFNFEAIFFWNNKNIKIICLKFISINQNCSAIKFCTCTWTWRCICTFLLFLRDTLNCFTYNRITCNWCDDWIIPDDIINDLAIRIICAKFIQDKFSLTWWSINL